MLGGKTPVIIFQFSKLVGTGFGDAIKNNRLLSKVPTFVEQPPIPIYLDERLTGLFVDTEDKNIDINTEVTTLSSGEDPEVDQNAIGSTVSVNLKARKDSIAMVTLSSMIDLAFNKVTSKEYAISYMNGVVTVFRAQLVAFNFSQLADTDLISIRLELTRGTQKTKEKEPIFILQKETNTIPLGGS